MHSTLCTNNHINTSYSQFYAFEYAYMQNVNIPYSEKTTLFLNFANFRLK